MHPFHPDLAWARFLPPLSLGPRSALLLNRRPIKIPAPPSDIVVEDVTVPGPAGAPPVSARIYRPRSLRHEAPALVWLHGGGMVLGNRFEAQATCIQFARHLGITVASVEYRLAPQYPAPAAIEDVYAFLTWLRVNATAHGVDPTRIAVGGESAGGGLAAGVTLLAHDRGQNPIAFQLLVYPMLDDRTVTRENGAPAGARVWLPKSNRYGWTSYLGATPGSTGVSAYAAPARRVDLSGLPPAWIGVGTLDLFHDEDIAYARRLQESGTPCELVIVPGAFHGFNVLNRTPVARNFINSQINALDEALFTRAG